MARQIIHSQAELDAFCLAVSDDKEVTLIAVDTETEMLAEDAVTESGKWLPWQLQLYGIGIYASKKHEAYIVHDDLFDYGAFDALLHSYPVVFHHAPFDLAVLDTHKVITQMDAIDVQDTKLMSHVENENKLSHRLKDLASSVLHVKEEEVVWLGDVGARPVQEQGTLFAGSEDEKKEFQEKVMAWETKLANYCMDDCKYTYKLFEKFTKSMGEESPDLIKVYSKLELPFMRVLYDMQRRGILLNKDYLSKLSQEVEDLLLDLGAKIYQEAGRQFDINSPKQLQQILVEKKVTMPAEYVTPKGAVSTNVAAMTYLAGEGVKLAEYMLKYRELTKLQTTYIQALPKLAVNGVIHCSWNQTGTKTGRISCSKPNLQQIPRRDDELNIRKAFRPREGYVFVIADYSQIELRVMAYFSQDKKLLKTYQEGGDIHEETSKAVGCSRLVAKQINFGLNYGRTAYGLAKDKKLKLSVSEAEKFIARYFQQFPRVKEFMDKSTNTVKKNKFVETIIGRRRRFEGYNSLPFKKGQGKWEDLESDAKKQLINERDRENHAMERQGANAIIQGCQFFGAKILVEGKGYVTIESVSGQKVKVWDGERFVNAFCMPSGKKELVETHLWGGLILRTSNTHLFLTQQAGSRESIWRMPSQFSTSVTTPTKLVIGKEATWNAKNLSFPELKKSKSNNARNISFALVTDRELLGELLGRLASDGSISEKACSWLVAEHEDDILPLLKASLEKSFGNIHYQVRLPEGNRKEKVHRIDICSECLSRQAKDMEIKKRIPDVAWANSDVLRGFLRGMFDGDGGVSGKTVTLVFGQPSIATIYPEDIQQALLLFGIKSRIRRYIDRAVVQISTPDNAQFQKEIGFMSKIKIDKLRKLVGQWAHTRDRWGSFNVKSVVRTGKMVEMYDIVNSDSGMFMADGVVTHNSASDLMKIAMRNMHAKLKPLGAYLLLQIHDEVVVEAPRDVAQQVLDIVKYEMEHAVDLDGVPLLAEPKITESWEK